MIVSQSIESQMKNFFNLKFETHYVERTYRIQVLLYILLFNLSVYED
jgi:hypothetical protein